jgi:hypothetical protein
MLFNRLRHREFIRLLGVGAAWPLEVFAQEPGRPYRFGGLTPSPRDAPHYAALFAELRRFGFIEGQNLTVDWRGYGVHTDQFPDIAVELVKAKADVIFCGGDAAVRAAQQATAPTRSGSARRCLNLASNANKFTENGKRPLVLRRRKRCHASGPNRDGANVQQLRPSTPRPPSVHMSLSGTSLRN